MQTVTYSDLTEQEVQLLNKAEAAISNAYNPYSKIFIGAAVLTSDKKTILGSSFRNNSAAVMICAERAALINAVSQGKRDIETIAVIGKPENSVFDKPVMPCGVCRQFMVEFVKINKKDITLICSNTDKTEIIKTSLNELLPLAYSGGIDAEKVR